MMFRSLGLAFLVICTVANVSDAACPRQGKSASRFILKGSDARDTRTGLTWQRCSVGMTWNDRQGCTGQQTPMGLKEALKAAETAGSGWRVPSINELYSLIDKQCGKPPVDVKVFPDLRSNGKEELNSEEDKIYWTSSESSDLGIAGMIYYVDFTTGDVDVHSKGFSLAVRLVRSGP
jgi:hypothetical protein